MQSHRRRTKGEVLEDLREVLESAVILPQIRLSVGDWKERPRVILKMIRDAGWSDIPLIIRSSALNEDTEGASMAGRYDSIGNVTGEVEIGEAIFKVISSYGAERDQDQVFIQPFLAAVTASGVAFSRDPSTGGHYIVINYDDKSGSTSTVTGGSTNDLKAYWVHRSEAARAVPELRRVVDLVIEIETLLGGGSVDIEFAVDRAGQLYLLQARPLASAAGDQVSCHVEAQALDDVARRLADGNKRHPFLCGERTVFGVMPDWNPAEIIGIRPRPLALSLYKDLVTDSVWAYQRDNYGYKNLRSFPLLIDFHGLPYIDVRVSFNSFIPAGVNEQLAEKLVTYYVNKLIEAPARHDKVEFEIVYSCYTLDLPERLRPLEGLGFTADECKVLADQLRGLTNGIINPNSGLWRKDLEKIAMLEGRRQALLTSDIDMVSKVYWLLEDCKRYGTLPFAGLARAGFIAVQLLQSLVATGVLSNDERQAFLSSLSTVSSELGHAYREIPRAAFLDRYGHLRPGMYDILSPRYDADPDRYFDWSRRDAPATPSPSPFTLSMAQLRRTTDLLKAHGLEHDVLTFFDFIKSGIEGREYAKFAFSKNVSDALELIKGLGATHGLTAEDCSFLDISCVRKIYASSYAGGDLLVTSVAEGRTNYGLTCRLTLPPLLTEPRDVWGFHLPTFEPNFITMKRVTGPARRLDSAGGASLEGAVVMIPQADPGFDWIFARGIGGFITMYGGVNSHMAIRAAELGIPAVIGAGMALYDTWAKARTLTIDCAARQVTAT